MENNTPNKINWDETKEKLIIEFAALSSNDLQQLVSKQDEILLKMQKKLEKTKEEIQALICGKDFSEIIISPTT